MGQDPDQVAYDLDRQRQSFKSRLNRLESRVRDDVQNTRDEARARVESVQSRVDRTVGGESPIAEHPRALVGGSFGLGFLAGFITGGGEDKAQEDRHVRQFDAREERRSQGPGLVHKGATMAYGPLGGALSQVVIDLQDDLSHFVRDLLRSGKNRLQEQFSSGNGRSGGTTWSVDHNDTRMPFEEERPTAEELLPRGRGEARRSDAPRAREHSKN